MNPTNCLFNTQSINIIWKQENKYEDRVTFFVYFIGFPKWSVVYMHRSFFFWCNDTIWHVSCTTDQGHRPASYILLKQPFCSGEVRAAQPWFPLELYPAQFWGLLPQGRGSFPSPFPEVGLKQPNRSASTHKPPLECKKANAILVCFSRTITSRYQEVVVLLYSKLVRLTWSTVSSSRHLTKKDAAILE